LIPHHAHHDGDASGGADDGRQDRDETEEKEDFNHAG
jgi:hypothetical protein